MKSFRKELWFEIPSQRGFVNITPKMQECLHESGIKEGLALVNISPMTTANVTVKFYDVNGNLSCVKTDTIPAMGVLSYWLPSLTCSP